MARHGKRGFLGELVRNPLIIGTAGGLVANLAGLSIPNWLEPTVSRIGGASLTLGLMAAGAGMQLSALNHAKLLGVAVLGIRHLLMPLLALGLSQLFGLSTVQSTILLMFAALPTASSSYVLAARMGYDGAYVAALVTVSTVLGMLSLPLALGVLRGFV
jgi:predicted permease